MAESGGCCKCCFSFIVTLGLTALFLWLSLRNSNPTCSIQYFYIPALNKTLNSTQNTTINIHLKLDNGNKDKGINYDAVNLTFYYPPNNTQHPIGNKTIRQFYQGHKKKATKKESVDTRGVNWEEVSRAVSNRTVVFRVDLVTAVRIKIMWWRTKRRKLMVGGDVEVNDQGIKVKKKGIKLKSGAPKHTSYRALQVMVALFLWILNF